MRRRNLCIGRRVALAFVLIVALLANAIALAEETIELGGPSDAIVAETEADSNTNSEVMSAGEAIALDEEDLSAESIPEDAIEVDEGWSDGRGAPGPVDGEEPDSVVIQSTAHTRSEALAWVNSQAGKALDYDGAYGAQCVDLTCYYYQYLGKGIPWGNANQYVNGGAFCPAGWSYQGSPQPGDIAVWTSGAYGHVAIVTELRGSQMVCMEQNYGGKMYCTSNVHNMNANKYIRPDWPSEIPGPIAKRPYVGFSTGYYVIRSAIGNRVLDIDGAKLHSNGANAQLWRPEDNVDQIFRVEYISGIKAKNLPDGGYRISLKESGKNLDAEGNVTSTITNVSQWDNYNGSNQHWSFQDAGDGWVYIHNKNGYYLDVQNGWDSNKDGGNVWAFTFNGTDAQKWKLIRVSGKPMTRIADGNYIMRSGIGNKTLDISGASKELRANAIIYKPNGTSAQVFRIGKDANKPANRIRLAQAGNENRWLDKDGDDGTGNVHQWEWNGSYGQNWFFEDAGGGWYYIRNMNGYYLDVCDAKNADGTNVQAWNFNGSNAQKWKPVKVSGVARTIYPQGTYVIRSKIGSRMLDVYGASSSEGAKVQLCQENGTAAQLFRIGWNDALEANNLRLLQSANDNRWIDAGKKDDTGPVSQFAGNGGHSQNWFFESAGGGWYYLRDIYGYYLDVKDAVNANGAVVQVHTFNGSDAQKWRVEKPNLAFASIDSVGQQLFTGQAVTPNVTVRYGGRVLRKGTDYTVGFSNNVAPGTASVSVVGKGLYSGSKSANFLIEYEAGVKYRTYIQKDGWQGWKKNGAMSGTSGRSLRLEGIKVKLAGKHYSGGIKYRTHVQGIGWQGWKKNGATSGTKGRGLRLEAIKVKLTGEMAKRYDVYYRVHAQKFGWMGWAKNGASAGTSGYSYRLEGIQIVVLPKGAAAPGATYQGQTCTTNRVFAKR